MCKGRGGADGNVQCEARARVPAIPMAIYLICSWTE